MAARVTASQWVPITYAAVLDDSYEPPVAVAVVQQDHGVALCRVRLALDGGHKGVQRIDKLEINVLCVL